MKKKTAVFIGKFQPPHLGHIITINRILKKFDKVIVGITYNKIDNLDPHKIKKILEEVFQTNENVSVVLINGSVEGGDAKLNHLNFDVALSGNNKVVTILKTKGYNAIFQPRSIGPGFSGSEVRSGMNFNSSKQGGQRNVEFNMELEELSKLKPHEKVLPNRLAHIESVLLKDGFMFKPIIVDNKYNVILDGSHRYAFLLKNGYSKAPVIKINYYDETIFVGNSLKHRYLIDKDLKLNKSKVIEAALNEKLLDARSSKNFFPFRKVNYPVKLENLIPGKKKNIDFLIEKTTIQDEIDINKLWINEIDEELEILNSYKGEQIDVKSYLVNQINILKKSNI